MRPKAALNPSEIGAVPARRKGVRTLLVAFGVLACMVGLYALVGWFGVPWLFERWLVAFEADSPSRTASIAAVRFNPFTLEAELGGIVLTDDPARAAFSAERLSIHFSAQSLRERRPIIDRVSADGPVLELARFEQLATILKYSRSNGLSQTRIDRLEFNDGRWHFGLNTERPIELARIAGSLVGFDGAAVDDARYSLSATSADGMSIESEGSLAPDLDRAAGRLTIDAAELATMAARMNGIANRIEPQGRLALTTGFTATQLLGMTRFELNDAAIEVTDLSLTPVAGFSAETAQASATANLVLTPTDDGIDIRGRLEFSDAAFGLHDFKLTPAQSFSVDEAVVLITADRETTGLSINLNGKLTDADDLMLTVRVPAEASAPSTVNFRAADLPTKVLSAYSLQTLGRALDAGRADLGIEYSMLGERVSGELNIVARNLTLAAPGATDDSSLDLAAALLENSDSIIEIDLPFVGNARRVRTAATDALSARIAALTATPFDMLQTGPDGDDRAPSAVPFSPGEAALNDRALATIGQLAAALNARPRLGLRVLGGYDEQADRTALARQQIQLHVLLATAGPTINARPRPVDFASPRAQDVLDEFAGERLASERINEIERLFDCGDGELALLCRRGYYAALFDALVANEEIANPALNRLARFRALSIVDALTSAGIESERLEVETGSDTIDTPFGIGLPIELTVATPAGGDSG